MLLICMLYFSIQYSQQYSQLYLNIKLMVYIEGYNKLNLQHLPNNLLLQNFEQQMIYFVKKQMKPEYVYFQI